MDKQKKINIIDANQKLLGYFLRLASDKDADYIEIAPDAIHISIHQKLTRASRQPTKKINQELIDSRPYFSGRCR